MPDSAGKLYYSISEVAKLVGVKAHVLRYWESEFPTLRPRKNRAGSRRYRQPDIAEIVAIKQLLYEEGFKIAGARKVRKQAKAAARERQDERPVQMAMTFSQLEAEEQLRLVREQLGEVLQLVRDIVPAADDEPAEAEAPLKKREAKG